MLWEIQKYVVTIDGRSGLWKPEVGEHLECGGNFFIILPGGEDAREELAHALEIPPAAFPKPLTRTRLFSLSPFIQTKDFDLLMSAQEANNEIYFIEQLDLPLTQPPRVKPYLLYGSVRGIISQHDNLGDAKQACFDYLNQVAIWRQQPEASIYKWQGKDWYNLELC
jgi:hypothetical protein